LTLARYDAQQHPALDADAVDVARLTYHVAREFMARAAQRGLRLELAVAADTRLAGDQDAIGVALRNLIDNALRFARSRVRIEASAHGADNPLDGAGRWTGHACADRRPRFRPLLFAAMSRTANEVRVQDWGSPSCAASRSCIGARCSWSTASMADSGVKLQLPVMPQAQESKVTER